MINAIHFTKKRSTMESNISEEKALKLIKSKDHCWIDIVDASKGEISKILKLLFPKYHSLILEDCIEDSKPKIDFYDSFIFLILKAYPKGTFQSSQVNIILGKDFVITFRKGEVDLSNVYNFFKQTKKTSDFVLYKILASIFDKCYIVLENSEARIDNYEEVALKNPTPQLLKKMLNEKRNLLSFHRTLLHEREVITYLTRGEIKFVKKDTIIFLRDVYDDVIHLLDSEETLRDVLSSSIDIYLSSVSNKMNEIMKTLTILASFVWIPTLIAGIYGMNFKNVILDWYHPYAFYIVLGIMAFSMIAFYAYFKKKGWI
ncbi:MAG: magnesium/cobalt transporter CorA [Nanoarchaeota archaeon]|nr:magnesium/cobalt transporter CorA [Nanoarchaeota archaeon]